VLIDFMDLKNKENVERVLICLALLYVKYFEMVTSNGEVNSSSSPSSLKSLDLSRTRMNSSSRTGSPVASPLSSPALDRQLYTPLRQRAKSLAVNTSGLDSPRSHNRGSLRIGSWSPIVGVTQVNSPHSVESIIKMTPDEHQEGHLTSREFDDLRQDALEVQQVHDEHMVLTWIQEQTNRNLGERSLCRAIKGGVTLCWLMAQVFPGSIRVDSIRDDRSENDFISDYNLNLFFEACKVVGVPGIETFRFTNQDLVKNNKKVVLACLLMLFERSKRGWASVPDLSSPATVATPRQLRRTNSSLNPPSPSYFEDRKSDPYVGNSLDVVEKLIEDLKNNESFVSEKLVVRSLGITDMSKVTDEQKEELIHLLSFNHKIKCLDLSNLNLSDIFVRDLAINMVSKKAGIERLDLSQNPGIGESARTSLLKLMEESETLVDLCLSGKKGEQWIDRFRMAERKRKQTTSFVLKLV